MASTSEEGWIGRVVDERYRIVALLGDGGMGRVYEAEHLALGKRVAFKVIHHDLVSDEEALARFEREARATAAIEHPHVASAIDFGRLEEGGAYLVVQLVPGVPLRKRIEAGPIGWREASTIGAQIADALAAIHARGFVHRDLTADNVLLTTTEDGAPFVHVLDLGVAGVLAPRDGEPRLTAEGHVVGTPGYMSPEQALGKPTDPRADLYSLGVLLWEMCTGRSLWGSRELTQIVASQLTEEPPPIPALASATAPPELGTLIAALLARSPDGRPSDAALVRDTLARLATISPLVPLVQRYRVAALLLAAWVTGGTVVLALALIAIFAFGRDETPAKRITPTPNVAAVSSAPVAAPPLSPEVEELIETMLSGRWRPERKRAAQKLVEQGSAPPWARAAAELEVATTCASRRAALERLIELAEPRTLPVVERMHEAPRTGCGRRRRFDCYGCVRDELERAYRALGGS